MNVFGTSAFFDAYSSIVGFVANHVALLTVAVTAVVFVRAATGVFPSGLRRVFRFSGITVWTTFRVLMLCWRSRSLQRLFFEFALVKSQGEKLDSGAWNELCSDFAVFVADHQSVEELKIEIKNCTSLTSRNFVLAVSRYFDFLATPKASAFYSIGRYDDYWHSVVRVAEAYITPSVLLSGLMSRFDSNWEIFIDRYRASVSSSRMSSCRTMELYGLFSWLLWGPSKEINWHDGWDGLCQLSYGDENNSLLAYADGRNGTLDLLRRAFADSAKKGGFGGLFIAGIRIIPKKEYVSGLRFSLDVGNAYFVDKIISDDGLSFVPVLVDVVPVEPRVSRNWYSTAYLWLLFERIGEDESFHPERAVAFFEHANIADPQVSVFLKERLADKAIAHFRKIFESECDRSSRYSFLCGMNKEIEDYFKRQIKKVAGGKGDFQKWMLEHLCLTQRREPTTVFRALDEFFGEDDCDLTFSEVYLSDRRSCADLSVFYSVIYSDSFPNDNERETLANILEYMKKSSATDMWFFKVLLAKEKDGRIVGGAVFDYFVDVNSVVIEFICVDPSLRTRSIGKQIWNNILKSADALAIKHGHPCAKYVFCEVESPEMKTDGDMRHLAFWRSNWFRRLDFNYVQPALGRGRDAVSGLWLLAVARFPESENNMPLQVLEGKADSIRVARFPESENNMPSAVVTKLLWNYIHYSMDVPLPEEEECFKDMKSEISRHDVVKLVEF